MSNVSKYLFSFAVVFALSLAPGAAWADNHEAVEGVEEEVEEEAAPAAPAAPRIDETLEPPAGFAVTDTADRFGAQPVGLTAALLATLRAQGYLPRSELIALGERTWNSVAGAMAKAAWGQYGQGAYDALTGDDAVEIVYPDPTMVDFANSPAATLIDPALATLAWQQATQTRQSAGPGGALTLGAAPAGGGDRKLRDLAD
ncbi:MAG: hypothetical protein HOB82_05010 [Alphaproteobacteria bacterium]|jgi:hypothetical protein|nr:hypothetical protein [Alphaproteobacteria bacterium]MBT7943496.1 hypothetical protein [Alphaproteobacteria bacterium]